MSIATKRAARINEVQQRLIQWAAHQEALTTQYEALQNLTGADCESPLLTAVFAVWAAYTVAVSDLVGDRSDWLQWYEYECQMGAESRSVKLGDKTIKVRTIRQLATVICS